MKKICVLYSGGVDSLYSAHKLAEEFDEIHLLSFYFPGLIRKNCIKKNIEILKRLHPKKNILFVRKDIHSMHKMVRGSIFSILKDMFKYKSTEVFCLGCKVSMFVGLVEYCKKKEIYFCSDGSSKAQCSFWESSQCYTLWNNFLNTYNIKRITPAYEANEKEVKLTSGLSKLKLFCHRDNQKKELQDAGFDLGFPIFDTHRFIQPLCIPGISINLIGILKEILFGEKKERRLKFVKKKIRKMRKK